MTYHDTREIFEHDEVTFYTDDLRTLFEIRGARDAYELFLTAFGESRPLDESLIRELQGCLTRTTYDERRLKLGERPVEYKQHDDRTGRNAVGVLPEEVSRAMQKLLDELREKNGDALIGATCFHVRHHHLSVMMDKQTDQGGEDAQVNFDEKKFVNSECVDFNLLTFG